MKVFAGAAVLVVVACLIAVPALAQRAPGKPGGASGMKGNPSMHQPMQSPGGMSSEERERFRQELNSARRDVYRDRGPSPGFDPGRAPHRPMPPEERERLRRDIRDANREFDRRR